MSVIEAPPIDHAPRIASSSVEDFPVPTGREEEWRFAPMDDIAIFLEPSAHAGVLVTDESPFVRVVDRSEIPATSWLPTDRPAAIARAGVTVAVVVDVPADAEIDEPIVIQLRGTAELNYGHVDVRVGRNARATVVLVHDAGVDASGSIVTTVDDGGSMTMLSILDGPPENVHLWHWHAILGRDSSFVGAVATLGGRVVRMMPSVEYRGPGASAELLGAFLAEAGQYQEHRIFVEHVLPHCSSNVVYKGALSGAGAHTVWVGDVLVRATASGTTTYELNRNLLLDDGPRADSVPNLELETGNVASAGHASATGRFDDEQLFYLESRGIPETVARQLVVRGFFVDVLSRIPSPEWRDSTLSRIGARLGMPDLNDGEVGE